MATIYYLERRGGIPTGTFMKHEKTNGERFRIPTHVPESSGKQHPEQRYLYETWDRTGTVKVTFTEGREAL